MQVAFWCRVLATPPGCGRGHPFKLLCPWVQPAWARRHLPSQTWRTLTGEFPHSKNLHFLKCNIAYNPFAGFYVQELIYIGYLTKHWDSNMNFNSDMEKLHWNKITFILELSVSWENCHNFTPYFYWSILLIWVKITQLTTVFLSKQLFLSFNFIFILSYRHLYTFIVSLDILWHNST